MNESAETPSSQVDFWFYHCAVFGYIADTGWALAPDIARYMVGNKEIIRESHETNENFMECAKKIIDILRKDGFK